jgi:LCP family protein required for cell wall assembly
MNRTWIIRILAGILCALILCAGGLCYYTYSMAKEIMKDPLSVFGKDDSIQDAHANLTVTATNDKGETVTKKYDRGVVNILFLGVDANDDRRAGKSDGGMNTDAMILFSFNFEKKTIRAITLPRDTRVEMDYLNAKGEPVKKSTFKINAAFAYGKVESNKDEYGFKNAMNTVSGVLGNVPVSHYVQIDMDGIGPIADSVGGVDVYVRDNMPALGYSKGSTVHLEGDACEEFCRTRYGVGDGGDLGRTQRQQDFFLAFAKKAKSTGIVNLFTNVYPQVSKYIKTNLSADEMLTMANSLNEMDVTDIQMYTLPGVPQNINGGSYYVISEEEADEMIHEIFFE